MYDGFYEKYIKLTERFDDSVADTESIKKATHTDGIGEAFEKGTKAVKGLFGKIKGAPAGKEKMEGQISLKSALKLNQAN